MSRRISTTAEAAAAVAAMTLEDLKEEEEEEKNVSEDELIQICKCENRSASLTADETRCLKESLDTVNKLRDTIAHSDGDEVKNAVVAEFLRRTKLSQVNKKLKISSKLRKKRTDNAYGTLNITSSARRRDSFFNAVYHEDFHTEDVAFVRRPKLATILSTRKFFLFKNRYMNAQRNRTLDFPTLPQPSEEQSEEKSNNDDAETTEMVRTRPSHRFIITADTQFGILMDGFAMENPSWDTEIEISRRAINKINAMKGAERPLYVCVCGDLVDTEGSFCQAMASWKKVMKEWERHLVFQQQISDWKEVWSHLDDDIALVCLCGNHDVGNRPTAKSIQTWKCAFGDDYLAFWVNGTYNIALNNCLFSDPSGAPDLFDEQLEWLEERLKYATEKSASQIFVYSHFPWFIHHEDEEDKDISGSSLPPPGWGEFENFLHCLFSLRFHLCHALSYISMNEPK